MAPVGQEASADLVVQVVLDGPEVSAALVALVALHNFRRAATWARTA